MTWCPTDKKDFLTNTIGQITPTGAVGKIIINCLKTNTLQNVVEIGTWNGLGSTKCILLGLQANSNFISIESHSEKQQHAIQNLKDILTPTVKLVWGSILKDTDIVNVVSIFPEMLRNPEFQRWHSIDIENIKKSPYILSELPTKIDFILFDGGEFTTYYEFQILFPRCTKFIALDDVNVSKCKHIRNILKANSNWKEIEYIQERNGFSLFQHV